MPSDITKTLAGGPVCRVRRWWVLVTRGPSKGSSKWLDAGVLLVGSDPEADLVLEDRSVSRRHLEIEATASGLRVRDLGSKNGTVFEGARIETAELPVTGAVLVLGGTTLSLQPDDERIAPKAADRERCGRLVGRSISMRLLFAQIERVAPATSPVLIHGETGTGKELVAEALHECSPRRDGPFVVVDCGAIPGNLLESELFGHVRGAFTGATTDRKGAFEQAHRGTIFFDEIGELPLDLQPKLLRVLDTGSVRPVGSASTVSFDARVVAATHRDLDQGMREGSFRPDLFFRLSVVRLEVPPLREHVEDVAIVAEQFLRELGSPPLPDHALAVLRAYPWPGNVRQLRNVIERAVAMAGGGTPVIGCADLDLPAVKTSPSSLMSMPYKKAKEELLARFTREYLEELLARHEGNVSAAAREAQTDRNWIVALARRYSVRIRD